MYIPCATILTANGVSAAGRLYHDFGTAENHGKKTASDTSSGHQVHVDFRTKDTQYASDDIQAKLSHKDEQGIADCDAKELNILSKLGVQVDVPISD